MTDSRLAVPHARSLAGAADTGHQRRGRTAGAPACLPALLAIVCSGCVGGMFFAPNATVYQTPADPYRQRYEAVRFASGDGTALTGWFVPAAGKAMGTVVHFHGNSENMTSHYGFVYWLPGEGYNLFTFDYRGYGASAGTPDIGGVVADGLAAIEYVRSRKDVDPGRIVVLGQSLGASVAATVVGKSQPNGVRGLFLDSPFASYSRVVAEHMRRTVILFPVSLFAPLMVGDEYSPDRWIDRAAPRSLLLLHGADDSTVDPCNSQELFDKARDPKELHIADGCGHLDALDQQRDKYRPLVREFLRRCLGDAAGPPSAAAPGRMGPS